MAVTTPSLPTTEDARHFEAIYAGAAGDASQIPWVDGRPHPALVTWLNAVAPSLVRCGARVAVSGCGLGEDAREVMRRGYDVLAFDCSSTAIDWAKRLDPDHPGSYVVADLFDLPARWKHRFDLLVEVNTIQALAPDRQADALRAVAELVSPRGHLLVICRGAEREPTFEEGPPWAITESNLLHAASLAGLVPTEPPCTFLDDETPPVLRTRALFHRA